MGGQKAVVTEAGICRAPLAVRYLKQVVVGQRPDLKQAHKGLSK